MKRPDRLFPRGFFAPLFFLFFAASVFCHANGLPDGKPMVSCDGNAEILYDYTVACGPSLLLKTKPVPGAIREWLNGTTGITIASTANLTVTQPGVYVFTVTTNVGGIFCTDADTIAITRMDAAPTLAATGDQISCAEPEATVIATPSGAEDPVFNWEGPGNWTGSGQNIAVRALGAYKVTVTDEATGCTAKTSATVSGSPGLPRVRLETPSGDVLTCDLTGVEVEVYVTGTTDFDITWDGPGPFDGSFDFGYIEGPGIYAVTAENLVSGCTGTMYVQIFADQDPPEVALNQAFVGCTSLEDTLLAVVTTSSTDLDFYWDGPSVSYTDNLAFVDQPGDYYLIVTNLATGCFAEIEFVVEEAPGILPAVAESLGVLTCIETEVPVSATSDMFGPEYEWTGPNGFVAFEQEPYVPFPGVYTVTITESLCTATATVTVEGNIAPPDLSTSVSGILDCINDTALLAAASLTPAAEFVWLDAAGAAFAFGPSITVTAGGDYTIEVSDPQNGCTTAQTLTVLEDKNTPAVAATGGILTCAMPTVTLEGAAAGPPPLQIQWAGPNGFSSNEPNPTVSEPGTYTFTATGENGCSASVQVEVMDSCIISTRPNLPGGQLPGLRLFPTPTDGPLTLESTGGHPMQSLRIFDTGGRLLRQSEIPEENKWQFQASDLPPGVYSASIWMAGRWVNARFVVRR